MLLKMNQIKVQYGKTTALNIVNPIEICEGDRIGVIGSNGAGKTTLVKSILGIVPYTGSIESKITPQEMAVHMQFNEYSNSMAVKHIMEAILQTKIKGNPKLQELIEFFEFEECLGKKFAKLSGGQKQRFTIILVMMQDASFTFYDEVTSGLDFETRQKLVERLVTWYQDKQTGLCIVSHYYEELEQLTNKLLILDQGKVIDFGLKDELFHKYCGRAVLILTNSPENQKLLNGYEFLASPQHLLAIECESTEKEQEIASLLIHHNINFKRSNNDIELMYMNAKAMAGGYDHEEK